MISCGVQTDTGTDLKEVLCPAGSSPPLPFHLPSRLRLSSSARVLKKPLFDIIFSINNTFRLSAPPSLWSLSINKTTHRTLYQAGSKKRETASLMKTKSLFLSVVCAKTATHLVLPWSAAHSDSSPVKFKGTVLLYFN